MCNYCMKIKVIGRIDTCMEFHEKLQELRKSKGLTQEELASALYVSRTAISKWESARGYPSIDSLREISKYFGVSIDELLSSEKILSIAEDENKANIIKICELIHGIVDVFTIIMIILPLYPNLVDGYYYSVNLFDYTQTTNYIRAIYWSMFSMLIVCGFVKIVLNIVKNNKGQKIVTYISVGLSIVLVLFMIMTRESYATSVAFILLIIKGILLLYRKGYLIKS